MGKLIVFDGLDASGKRTQSEILKQKLTNKIKNVKLVSYPNYSSDSSFLVKLYLKGKIDTDPFKVNPYIATSFYAADHYITYKNFWERLYNDEGVVICDRYVSSNAIHQMAKLDKKDWDGFLSWLYDFEIVKIGLPKEDVLIYLDVDILLSQNLMKQRLKSKDIHEGNLEYLKKCKEAAFYCAKKMNWEILKCCNDTLLSVEEISERIEAIIFKKFKI